MTYEIEWSLEVRLLHNIPHVAIVVDEAVFDVYFSPNGLENLLKKIPHYQKYIKEKYNRKSGFRKRTRSSGIIFKLFKDNYYYIRREAPKLLVKEML